MKKQKMSLERMKGVHANVLTREEMKEVMAGSGGGGDIPCGACTNETTGQSWYCYHGGMGNNCLCNGIGNPCG